MTSLGRGSVGVNHLERVGYRLGDSVYVDLVVLFVQKTESLETV